MNSSAKISKSFLSAIWPAPANIKTLITTRKGGFSITPFDTLNLATHVGDDIEAVTHNRALVQNLVSAPIAYLNQIHGNQVVDAFSSIKISQDADACFDDSGKVACAVLTADCLPILLCDQQGTKVAAIHAGWRGLASGIIENTLTKMSSDPTKLMAYLCPAISQDAYEVGADVLDIFCGEHLKHYHLATCFLAIENNKYLANLYQIASQILTYHGINQIYGGEYCTVIDKQNFFSYRNDGQTGRFASIIWINDI